MPATAPNSFDRTQIHDVVEPFIEDLRDWRQEVTRLLGRARASHDNNVLDYSLVNEVEIAREGLDWEIEAFDAVARDLGATAPEELRIDDLGRALHSLHRATELLADMVDDMAIIPDRVLDAAPKVELSEDEDDDTGVD